jgi:hypothetical protein
MARREFAREEPRNQTLHPTAAALRSFRVQRLQRPPLLSLVVRRRRALRWRSRSARCATRYSPLDVRDVTPCFVCGGWAESVARFDPAAAFTEFRLPGGRPLVLCRACELEEFMVPGGWGDRLIPGERLPVNGLRRVRGRRVAAARPRQVLPGVQPPAGVRGGGRGAKATRTALCPIRLE